MTNSADPDQKPTDLDLHCLQRQGISGFSRTRVKAIRWNDAQKFENIDVMICIKCVLFSTHYAHILCFHQETGKASILF